MLALLACLLTAGCSVEERLQGLGSDSLPRGPVRPMLSAVNAVPGSRIAIAIEPAPDGLPVLAGVEGELRFDPAKLAYAGQAAQDSLAFPLVVVNDAQAAQGRLRVLSLDPAGLAQQTAVLAFEVRASDYSASVRYSLTQAVTTAVELLPASSNPAPAGLNGALLPPNPSVRLTSADWQALERRFREAHPARLIDSVPAGRRYGDIDTSGTITIVDASRASNWAVGNPSPPGSPIPGPGDFAELAGNVAPVNAPGLGESADDKGPGWDANCVRTWSILDGANIGNEAVGNDRPVVGELIPADAVDPATKLPRRGSACPGSVPALPPDSVPAAILAELYAGTNMLKSPIGKDLSPRNLLLVAFKPSSSTAERQVAIDAVSGTVVGGHRVDVGAWYYVRLPNAISFDDLLAAIDRLESFPQVDNAIVSAPVSTQYRRPIDGDGWKIWKLKPSEADASNWALEAIAAPMAWGCDTGSKSVTIGVVDHAFSHRLDLDSNVDASSRIPLWLSGGDSAHGTGVASAIAAKGNSGIGMTGVNWTASLLLIDIAATFVDTKASAYADGVTWLSQAGARIVNLSAAYPWTELHGLTYQPSTRADSAEANGLYVPLKRALDSLQQHCQLPLLVIAAGDNGPLINDWWSGFTRVAADFPNNVLVVGGAANLPGFPGTFVPDARASTGPLIGVAAPSDEVYTLAIDSVPRPSYGTSFAAPLVSGVAGLLLSFDPSLTPVDLKSLIIAGAIAGNKSVDDKPLLNAYESLRLAANRPSAPLCSNRVWSSGGTVYAERQGGPQVLYTGPDTVRFLYTYHGGRRVDLGFSAAPVTRALSYTGGTWTLNTNPSSLPIGLPGSTWTSEHGTSHDMDSAAYANSFPVAGGRRIDVSYGTSSSIGRAVGTTTIPIQNGATDSTCGKEVAAYDSLGAFTGYQCVGQTPFSDWAVLFPQAITSPLGDRILIVLNRDSLHITGLSPWVLCLGGSVDPQGTWSCRQRGATYVQFSQRADVWQVPLAGGTPSPLWSRSSQAISWLGFSEDAGRAVMGTGTHSIATGPFVETHTNCTVEYISPNTGVADTVVPSPVACRESRRGPGGFAPIRQR